MLDFDLAQLYEVETRVLNQAVKRNIKRFPIDFMFQLSKEEFEDWLKEPEHGPEDLKQAAECGDWGGAQPSELFLKARASCWPTVHQF